MPGFRDRIARVRLEAHEGGLNLNMEPDVIAKVSARGETAAKKILARFDSASPADVASDGWDEQRFVRLGVLLKMIEARITGIAHALDPHCPYVTAFDTLIDRATREAGAGGPDPAPPGFEKTLTPQQADELRQALRRLTLFAAKGSGFKTEFKSLPEPQLRIRPPL